MLEKVTILLVLPGIAIYIYIMYILYYIILYYIILYYIILYYIILYYIILYYIILYYIAYYIAVCIPGSLPEHRTTGIKILKPKSFRRPSLTRRRDVPYFPYHPMCLPRHKHTQNQYRVRMNYNEFVVALGMQGIRGILKWRWGIE